MAFSYDTKAQSALSSSDPVTCNIATQTGNALLVAAYLSETTAARTGGTPTWEYIDKFKSVLANPRGIFFKSDGTEMYVLGQTATQVNQYTLTTAWDVTTASYVDNCDVSSQDPYPYGLFFSPDGTKMYIVGDNNNAVYQYTLSTAWDISSASYASKSCDISSEEVYPTNLSFSSDGEKMYVVGDGNNTVYQYTLTTAWDVSTASYANKSCDVSSEENETFGLCFSSDGTKMYVVGYSNDSVFQYTLTTAWDVSTASYASKSFNVSGQETEPAALSFSNDGTKLYVAGTVKDTVYQYTVNTAWDVSTTSLSSENLLQAGTSQAGSGECNSELWYLIAPTVGVGRVSFPNTGTKESRIQVALFTGTGASFFSSEQTGTSSATPQMTINSVPDGSVVVSCLAHGDKDIPSARSHTIIYENDEGGYSTNAQYELKSGTGNTTHSWTMGKSDDVAAIMAAWEEEAGGVTVEPTALSLSATLNAPTVVIDCSYTATALALSATLNSPTILLQLTVSPSALAAALALNAPNISIVQDATVTPSALDLTAAINSPTMVGDVTVSPSALSLAATSPAPAVICDVTIIPSALTLTSVIVDPTISIIGNAIVTPTALSLSAVINAPTIVVDITVSPSSLALTAASPAPSVVCDVTVSLSALALSAAVIDPTVSIVQNATATPSALDLTAAINAPTIVVDVTVSPSSLALSATVTTPAVVCDVTVSPSALALSAAVIDPTVSIVQNATATPSALALTAAVIDPVVDISGNVTIYPSAEALTAAIQDPAVIIDVVDLPTAIGLSAVLNSPDVVPNTIVAPATLSLSSSQQAPAIIIDAAHIASALNLTGTIQAPSLNISVDILPSALAMTGQVVAPSFAVDSVFAPSALDLQAAINAPTIIAGEVAMPWLAFFVIRQCTR